MADWKNRLYFGDNLRILSEHIGDETVDLIYLDPPFNSNATYNVLFGDATGEKSSAQITAFEDTWHWGEESWNAYHETVTNGPKRLSDLLQALHQFLGQNDMMAYLAMMAPRLVELHRVLKRTGSIYLHCDSTASHYLKMVMDAVFDPRNFRNEIIWQRTGAHNDARRWGRVTDTILFYTKTDDYTWNPQYAPYDDEYVQERYHYKDPATGRMFWPNTMTAAGPGPARLFRGKEMSPPPGTHWRFSQAEIDRMESEGRIYYSKKGVPYVKSFLDERKGKVIQSLWADIRMTKSGIERIGYPTQKPEALLERIIRASSNEGDLVLDPFCGCGTAVVAAERLHRRWIGIDITHLAIALMKHRLHEGFRNSLSPYQVVGVPIDIAGAEALALENRHQFEWWSIGLVDARPAHDRKKGADSGTDGYINFFDDAKERAKLIVVQAKSGHVTVSQIRDLKGVMERERAAMGVFITLQEPTKPMIAEALSAGFYSPPMYPDVRYPKIQIVTIKDLLEGKQIEYPRMGTPATFKRVKRLHKESKDQQGKLF